MPAISGIDHIALTVADLAVSLEFYGSVLGLRPTDTMSDGAFTRTVLGLPGSTHLGLTQHQTGSGRSFDPTTPGLDHLGFACESRAALVEWVEHLDGLGIEHGGLQEAAYGSALSFRDPDGNALELFVSA